jgi:hypothetical protein
VIQVLRGRKTQHLDSGPLMPTSQTLAAPMLESIKGSIL